MSRLVVVSNRVPPRERSSLAGGLAVALREAIAGRDTLWFGWSGATSPAAAPRMHRMGGLIAPRISVTTPPAFFLTIR